MHWTGPLEDDWEVRRDRLRHPVPPERWPFGPPEAHEDVCLLHEGGLYCDCAASDASAD
jgi:hypothetical protein